MTLAGSHVICRLSEIDDPGSRAFAIGEGGWPLRGFVVRVDAQVFAYVNRCPHAGHPLNWRPDEFLTQDKSLIMCRSHGALFDRTTGECLAGPCAGRGLRQLATRVEHDLVILDADREIEALT